MQATSSLGCFFKILQSIYSFHWNTKYGNPKSSANFCFKSLKQDFRPAFPKRPRKEPRFSTVKFLSRKKRKKKKKKKEKKKARAGNRNSRGESARPSHPERFSNSFSVVMTIVLRDINALI
ncbi:hypothetical protein CEXT_499531 [Caerostris extrusa]|uniref:Uncharacterized protein n=1 Tax=Caerostris extrusa TaxID=172846 RepID=A0AAV4YAI7_CAEEX|nr:hypothetical protein CEXT_499531 [Caerostris extrusa]